MGARLETRNPTPLVPPGRIEVVAARGLQVVAAAAERAAPQAAGTGEQNFIIPFPHVSALVEGAVVAARIRVGSHVGYCAGATEKIRAVGTPRRVLRCRCSIALRRIERIAAVAVVIGRLIPLVFARDRDTVLSETKVKLPTHRTVRRVGHTTEVIHPVLGRAIALRPRRLPVRQPVREAGRVPEGDIPHRFIRLRGRVIATGIRDRHVRIVEIVRVGRRHRVQEGRVLAVRHLVGADVVVVGDCADSRHRTAIERIRTVPRIAHEDCGDVDRRRSGGSGKQASREEGVLDRFHAWLMVCGEVNGFLWGMKHANARARIFFFSRGGPGKKKVKGSVKISSQTETLASLKGFRFRSLAYR